MLKLGKFTNLEYLSFQIFRLGKWEKSNANILRFEVLLAQSFRTRDIQPVLRYKSR